MMNLREEIEKYCIANPQKEYEGITEKFLAYWEKEIKGEPRWMREKQFKLPQRLAQWKKNEVRFSNKKKIDKFRQMMNRINTLK